MMRLSCDSPVASSSLKFVPLRPTRSTFPFNNSRNGSPSSYSANRMLDEPPFIVRRERVSGLPPRLWPRRPRSHTRSWSRPLFVTKELTEVGEDDICTVCSEVVRVIASSNANHMAEPAGTPCFDADNGVFEDDGAGRQNLELTGRFQEHVRCRLACKAEPLKIEAIHANIKELR